jgi:hypothetical protein
MKEIKVFSSEKYLSDFPDTNLIEFIRWANDMLDSIPEEYRAEAEIDIDPFMEYGDADVTLKIVYYRPWTMSEIAQKNKAEVEKALRAAQASVNNVNRLKKEYGLESLELPKTKVTKPMKFRPYSSKVRQGASPRF